VNRRDFLAFAAVAALTPGTAAAATRIEVYKSSSCGCCGKWVEHLRLNRFDVTVHEVDDPAVYRARAGIPSAFASCHTALVDGYAVEGHVPAQDIRSLLKNRPNALGLAVPGMPKGSQVWKRPDATRMTFCSCKRTARRACTTRIPRARQHERLRVCR